MNLAAVLERVGETRKAEAECARALAERPQHTKALYRPPPCCASAAATLRRPARTCALLRAAEPKSRAVAVALSRVEVRRPPAAAAARGRLAASHQCPFRAQVRCRAEDRAQRQAWAGAFDRAAAEDDDGL